VRIVKTGARVVKSSVRLSAPFIYLIASVGITEFPPSLDVLVIH
jgi:hypothetical protein